MGGGGTEKTQEPGFLPILTETSTEEFVLLLFCECKTKLDDVSRVDVEMVPTYLQELEE